jgi:hypothetical protein
MEGINMKNRIGGALMALAFVFGIIAATSPTAAAQWQRSDQDRDWRRNRDNRNRGYDNYGNNNQEIQQGYQYGLNTGAGDGQRGQSYSPQRSRYYRNASSQAFRDGFVRGYDEGYRQYARNGGYRNDGSYGNGGYGNDPYYGNGGYGNGGYNNQEINRGYQQGLNTGASDGQNGKSYSPQRSRYYQNASTQAFRDGFVRGYDAGYRQYSNGGYRRTNTGSIWDQIFRRP